MKSAIDVINKRFEAPGFVSMLFKDMDKNNIAEKAEKRLQPVPVQPMDVLSGKGKKLYSHPGNIMFRNIVVSHVSDYLASRSASRKAQIVESIILSVHNQGGKFLRKHQLNHYWITISQVQIRDKVTKALRDASRRIRTATGKDSNDPTIQSESSTVGASVASLDSHPSKLIDFDSESLESNGKPRTKNEKSIEEGLKKQGKSDSQNLHFPSNESQPSSRQSPKSGHHEGISMQTDLPTESPSMLRSTFAARTDLDSSSSSDCNYYKTCEELCLEIDDALEAVRSIDSNISSDEKPKFKEVQPTSTSKAIGPSDEVKHALSSSSGSTISSLFKDNTT